MPAQDMAETKSMLICFCSLLEKAFGLVSSATFKVTLFGCKYWVARTQFCSKLTIVLSNQVYRNLCCIFRVMAQCLQILPLPCMQGNYILTLKETFFFFFLNSEKDYFWLGKWSVGGNPECGRLQGQRLEVKWSTTSCAKQRGGYKCWRGVQRKCGRSSRSWKWGGLRDKDWRTTHQLWHRLWEVTSH